MLSADGIFIVVATVSEQDGSSRRPARGARPRRARSSTRTATFIEELREAVEDSLDRAAEQRVTEIDVLEQILHDDLAQFIYERLAPAADGAAGRRRGLRQPSSAAVALAAGARERRPAAAAAPARRRDTTRRDARRRDARGR